MKKLIILVVVFISISAFSFAYGWDIYGFTIEMDVGNCKLYQTTFYHNNGTPNDHTDDYILGIDTILKCPPGLATKLSTEIFSTAEKGTIPFTTFFTYKQWTDFRDKRKLELVNLVTAPANNEKQIVREIRVKTANK